MEEDIVERLRDPRWVKYNPEAADEIEKLRALHPANIDYILVNGVRTDMRDVQIVYREVTPDVTPA